MGRGKKSHPPWLLYYLTEANWNSFFRLWQALGLAFTHCIRRILSETNSKKPFENGCKRKRILSPYFQGRSSCSFLGGYPCMYQAGIIEPREWKHCPKLNPFFLRDCVLYLYINMMNHQKSSTTGLFLVVSLVLKPQKTSRGPPLQTRPNPDFLMPHKIQVKYGEIFADDREIFINWSNLIVYLPASCADGSLQTHGKILARKKVEIKTKNQPFPEKKLGRLSPNRNSQLLEKNKWITKFPQSSVLPSVDSLAVWNVKVLGFLVVHIVDLACGSAQHQSDTR